MKICETTTLGELHVELTMLGALSLMVRRRGPRDFVAEIYTTQVHSERAFGETPAEAIHAACAQLRIMLGEAVNARLTRGHE